jgi:type VI secretion system protein ImpG
MVNDLYFEEELRYLREEGERFARMYPQRARSLGLDSIRGGGNTYVERLFEGFAFLSAGIKKRLDDSFPELTEGLVDMLWPRLLEPVPPTCIVEFTPRSGALQGSRTIDKGAEILTASDTDTAISCRFLTTRDVIINSLALDNVECVTGASGKDTMTLAFTITSGVRLESLQMAPLRLYIHADLPSALRIRKSLLCDVEEVIIRDNFEQKVRLVPEDTFVEGGFDEDDDLFPERQSVNRPLSLIRDYFTFPERFLFVDIFGLDSLPCGDTPPSTLFLDVRFNKKIPGGTALTKSNFKLYCVPAVNIFRRNAEPLYINGEKNEYDMIADAVRPKCYAINSVESVIGIDAVTGERRVYGKFRKPDAPRSYSLRREHLPDGNQRIKLSMNGRQTEKGRIIREMLHIETWQTNGTLARKTAIGGNLRNSAPNFPNFVTFENITTPNNPISPPNSDEYLWIFLSHLATTYSDFNDAEKLKDFLYAYDWIGTGQQGGMRGGTDTRGKRPEVEAILSVTFKLVDLAVDRAVIRGTEMNVAIDEKTATEESMFLLGTVLARALSCMASINTFLRLVFTMSASGKKFEWCCQAGERAG